MVSFDGQHLEFVMWGGPGGHIQRRSVEGRSLQLNVGGTFQYREVRVQAGVVSPACRREQLLACY